MKRYLAEMVGTFAMVFCGTGAIVVNEVAGGIVGHVGVAVTFGLIVMAMIYSFGDISGAHINPAVTVGFWLSGRFAGKDVAPYISAQLLGAMMASGLLLLLFPHQPGYGETLPAGTVIQTFVLEIILTFFLMLVIIHVSTGSKEMGTLAGIAIGSVILLEALFAGPITGASMNPARSLAPALVAGNFQHLWIYLTAPFIGAALAIPCCRLVKGKQCCDQPGAHC